ncbi:hypothetical protein QP156_12965, partial [Staphylococcus caprae]|nr:hypothetical protein [Staphylococcus caprae]
MTFLEQEKQIVTDGNGEYQLASVDTEITGIFRANEKGFGFVRIDDEENADDIFVGPDNTLLALDSDYVRVKIIANGNPWNGKGPEGKVIEILERGVETLVGEFYPLTDVQVKLSGFCGYVISSNKKFKNYKIYTPVDGITPQMGDMVKVSISQYPTEDMPENMQGAILETIGN